MPDGNFIEQSIEAWANRHANSALMWEWQSVEGKRGLDKDGQNLWVVSWSIPSSTVPDGGILSKLASGAGSSTYHISYNSRLKRAWRDTYDKSWLYTGTFFEYYTSLHGEITIAQIGRYPRRRRFFVVVKTSDKLATKIIVLSKSRIQTGQDPGYAIALDRVFDAILVPIFGLLQKNAMFAGRERKSKRGLETEWETQTLFLSQYITWLHAIRQ